MKCNSSGDIPGLQTSLGSSDLHQQQVWPKFGILQPRKGQDSAPETLRHMGGKALVKSGIRHFPAVDFHSCRKVLQTRKSCFFSAQFQFLLAPRGSPCVCSSGVSGSCSCRGGSSPGCRSGGLSHDPEVPVEGFIPRGGVWLCCLQGSGLWRGEGMLTFVRGTGQCSS